MFRVEDRVEALFDDDEHWYPGRVVEGDDNRGYDVQFDDGDFRPAVPIDEIRLLGATENSMADVLDAILAERSTVGEGTSANSMADILDEILAENPDDVVGDIVPPPLPGADAEYEDDFESAVPAQIERKREKIDRKSDPACVASHQRDVYSDEAPSDVVEVPRPDRLPAVQRETNKNTRRPHSAHPALSSSSSRERTIIRPASASYRRLRTTRSHNAFPAIEDREWGGLKRWLAEQRAKAAVEEAKKKENMRLRVPRRRPRSASRSRRRTSSERSRDFKRLEEGFDLRFRQPPPIVRKYR